jgi:hypothetical protein
MICGVVDRACRGSVVPFRAFWREGGVRFQTTSPSGSRTRSLGVPNKSRNFCIGRLNCDALVCMVKLLYRYR